MALSVNMHYELIDSMNLLIDDINCRNPPGKYRVSAVLFGSSGRSLVPLGPILLAPLAQTQDIGSPVSPKKKGARRRHIALRRQYQKTNSLNPASKEPKSPKRQTGGQRLLKDWWQKAP